MSEAKAALITGVSSRIGRGIADELVARSWRVATTGRARSKRSTRRRRAPMAGPLCYGTSSVRRSPFCVCALPYRLRNEWRPKGVAVVSVSAGFIDSDIVTVDNRKGLQESAAEALSQPRVGRLEDVVLDRVRGSLPHRREVTITRHGKLAAQFARLFPGASDLFLRHPAPIPFFRPRLQAAFGCERGASSVRKARRSLEKA